MDRVSSMKENTRHERVPRIEKYVGRSCENYEGALRMLGGSEFALDVLRQEGFKPTPVYKAKRTMEENALSEEVDEIKKLRGEQRPNRASLEAVSSGPISDAVDYVLKNKKD